MSTDVQVAWGRAVRLIEVGRPAEAERELRRALAAEPDDAFCHAMLANCLYIQDKHDAALAEAGEAIRLAPDEDMGYYQRALVMLADGKFKLALEAARRAAELDNNCPENLGLLGRCCERLNRWPEALDAAERGLSVDPKNPRCVAVRADALRALGRADEARAALRGQLADDPEHADTHADLGWHALRTGDRAEAMTHFREALHLDPQSASARRGLAAAMQSRSPLYGWFFRFRLWLADQPAWWPWGLLAVGVVAPRLIPPLTGGATWGVMLSLVLRELAFVFWYLWSMLPAIGTVLLWSDRDGRRAMGEEQRAAVKWFLPALLLAAGAAIASPLIGKLGAITLMLPPLLIGSMVPAAYGIPAGPRRRWMGAFTACTVAVAFIPAVGVLLVQALGPQGLNFWVKLIALTGIVLFLPIGIGALLIAMFADTIAKWIAGPAGTRQTIF